MSHLEYFVKLEHIFFSLQEGRDSPSSVGATSMCVRLPLFVHKNGQKIRVVDDQIAAVNRPRVLQRQACVLKVGTVGMMRESVFKREK